MGSNVDKTSRASEKLAKFSGELKREFDELKASKALAEPPKRRWPTKSQGEPSDRKLWEMLVPDEPPAGAMPLLAAPCSVRPPAKVQS